MDLSKSPSPSIYIYIDKDQSPERERYGTLYRLVPVKVETVGAAKTRPN